MPSIAAAAFKSRLTFNEEAAKLFRKRDWQRAMKSGLISAGRDFIAGALPKRFTDFAIDQLGYDARKLHQDKEYGREPAIRRAIALMRVNGQYDKIVASACAPWGGWDPTAKGGPNGDVWARWFRDAVVAGRVKTPKTAGDWSAARAFMRRDVKQKSQLKERVRNFAIDEYIDRGGKGQGDVAPIPLVETSELELFALSNARPDAKTRAGRSDLYIRIPRPHPVHSIVNKTLSKSTPEEAERVASIFSDEMKRFVSGASVNIGRKRTTLRASKSQKRRINSLINGALARAPHTNRPSTAHSAKK